MTQKLLFVDDSRTMHRVVAITFGQENVTLVSAHSAAEAMELVSQTSVDVALVDVHLGDMDGYTLCAKLQEHLGPRVPVLLLVSDQHPLDEHKSRASGAFGAVKKPFDTQTLVARVREAQAQAQTHASAAPSAKAHPPADQTAAAEQHDSGAPPRPAFFQAPPPIPPAAQSAAGSSTPVAAPWPAEATNPWTVGTGGPPAMDDLPPAGSHAPRMPQATDLPQMPAWSIDLNATAPQQAPLPKDIPAHEPLWSEKESTTSEDLRRPEIDVSVVQLARADHERELQASAPLAQNSTAPPPAQTGSIAQVTQQALQSAFAGLPAGPSSALPPPALAQALTPALVQAIERAVWDILPTIVRDETRAYLKSQSHNPEPRQER